jgi:hypothetical protein
LKRSLSFQLRTVGACVIRLAKLPHCQNDGSKLLPEQDSLARKSYVTNLRLAYNNRRCWHSELIKVKSYFNETNINDEHKAKNVI